MRRRFRLPGPVTRTRHLFSAWLLGAVCLLATVATSAAGAGTSRGGQTLQQAWVVGAQSVWAWTEDETSPVSGGGAQAIDRTADGGGRWADVTPAGLSTQGARHWITGLFALDAADAWVTYGGLPEGNRQTIVRTTDGGRDWTVAGQQPGDGGCELQFISVQDGWCTFIGGAAGSETVAIYRTADGGGRWRLVSNTPIGGRGRAGTLPFSDDKTVDFTNAGIGWAPFLAPVGTAQLFESVDGGGTWIQRHVDPAPYTRLGGGFAGRPLVEGRYGAVGYSDDTQRGPRTIVYVTSDGGLRWRPIVPPGPAAPWFVDTLTPRSWRLLDGNRLLETEDGGRTWRTIVGDHRFGPLYEYSPITPVVDFVTHRLGWVVQANPAGGSTLWRSVDGGHHWLQVLLPHT